jgi:acetyl esterase/lipase
VNVSFRCWKSPFVAVRAVATACAVAFAAGGPARFATAETATVDFGPGVTAESYKQASGDDLMIYRFQPATHDATKDRRPAAVFFFGGGWTGGSVQQFEQHARYLAGRGMVAFVADYRVKSRQGTGPDACVADGKSAVRWRSPPPPWNILLATSM